MPRELWPDVAVWLVGRARMPSLQRDSRYCTSSYVQCQQAARWSSLESAIAAWTPSNNTFPALPSHPQRIVGWASLALATAELAAALEYGGHASLHVDVARRAVTDCAG